MEEPFGSELIILHPAAYRLVSKLWEEMVKISKEDNFTLEESKGFLNLFNIILRSCQGITEESKLQFYKTLTKAGTNMGYSNEAQFRNSSIYKFSFDLNMLFDADAKFLASTWVQLNTLGIKSKPSQQMIFNFLHPIFSTVNTALEVVLQDPSVINIETKVKIAIDEAFYPKKQDDTIGLVPS